MYGNSRYFYSVNSFCPSQRLIITTQVGIVNFYFLFFSRIASEHVAQVSHALVGILDGVVGLLDVLVRDIGPLGRGPRWAPGSTGSSGNSRRDNVRGCSSGAARPRLGSGTVFPGPVDHSN